MNFLQRLAARIRAAIAALRGMETGTVTPLPTPLVSPQTPTAQLVADADARGVADARAYMVDHWSFGGPDDTVSDAFDPDYVLSLRHQCETAVAGIRQRQDITTSRVAHVARLGAESTRMMDSARAMMAGLAVREARMEAETIRRSQAEAGIEATAEDLPNVAPDDAVWEGETNVLGLFWRLLILAGLMLAEFPVQYFVYRHYFGGSAITAELIVPVTLSTCALMVIPPYVAGLLIRGRQATGAQRRLALAVLILAVPWLYVAGILGLVRARILDTDAATLDSISRRLHLTPVTVVVMFIALLLIIGAMSFLLGLARRHPFQEAYARQRDRRARLDALRQDMAQRINPAYREPPADGGALSLEDDERAVRESYAAAEEAYFAALARTVGDPTFTEAVQQRRGRR